VAQPETRLALLCWLANAPHCFFFLSLQSSLSRFSWFCFLFILLVSKIIKIKRSKIKLWQQWYFFNWLQGLNFSWYHGLRIIYLLTSIHWSLIRSYWGFSYIIFAKILCNVWRSDDMYVSLSSLKYSSSFSSMMTRLVIFCPNLFWSLDLVAHLNSPYLNLLLGCR